MIDVPFIVNEKVFLRPAELQDVPMFQRCSNLPEVRYALFTAFPENRIRLNEWVEGLYKNHDSIVLVMVDKEPKELSGIPHITGLTGSAGQQFSLLPLLIRRIGLMDMAGKPSG